MVTIIKLCFLEGNRKLTVECRRRAFVKEPRKWEGMGYFKNWHMDCADSPVCDDNRRLGNSYW